MTKIYTFMNVPCSYFQSKGIQQQPAAAIDLLKEVQKKGKIF